MVFFEDNNRILSGNILDLDGVELQVHATVQANKKEHRFVPLYTNSKGDKVPREKPHAKFAPCIQCVNQSQVLATAPIETFLVPKSVLSSLRSRGVVMSPIIVTDDEQHATCTTGSEGTEDIITADSATHHDDMVRVLDEIPLERSTAAPSHIHHCRHQQDAVVFPVNINSLSQVYATIYFAWQCQSASLDWL